MLTAILEAARWTGSAKNRQPWELIVVRDREVLAALAGLGPYSAHLASAALAIVAAVPRSASASTDQFDHGRLSQSLMLAAHALGLGSCIAWFWPSDNERSAELLLEVPDAYAVHFAIAFGYPRSSAAGSSVTSGRRLVRSLVHYERFGSRRP